MRNILMDIPHRWSPISTARIELPTYQRGTSTLETTQAKSPKTLGMPQYLRQYCRSYARCVTRGFADRRQILSVLCMGRVLHAVRPQDVQCVDRQACERCRIGVQLQYHACVHYVQQPNIAGVACDLADAARLSQLRRSVA
jgi:hypothetical protein